MGFSSPSSAYSGASAEMAGAAEFLGSKCCNFSCFLFFVHFFVLVLR